MNVRCNLFRNSFSPICEHEVSVMKILHAIKDGKWKDIVTSIRECEDKNQRNELKKLLPGATFSGTFNDRRKESNIKVYSHLMVIDIDNIKSNELRRFKASLKEDPFIVSFFESPSRGLKVLVEVDSPVEFHKTVAFPYVEEYFKDMHGIVIDKSGKDISRLCYVSYDPELYIAEEYDIFRVPEEFLDRERQSLNKRFQAVLDDSILSESTDSSYVFGMCKRWVSEGPVGNYHTGNRNNFIHALACCLNRAGMSEDMSISYIALTYQSLEVKEIETTVSSAYRHNKGEFGSRPVLVKRSNQIKIFNQ